MMKKFTLLFALLMAVSMGFSQYYYLPFINAGTNPGGLNTDAEYPNGGGLDASWTQILAGSQTTPAWSTTQSIPFTFNFNGAAVTSFKVSSSGILTFTTSATTAPTYTNAAIPNAAIPDKSLCLWGLRADGTNDNIMMKTFGTAPNRQLWVFFASYNFNGGSTSTWTYWSIVLEETSNNIYFVDQRTGNGTTALTIGIQVNSTTAYSVTGSPAIANNASTDATAADNSYYQFIYGTMPARDIKMAKLNLPGYVQPNNVVDVKGTLTNLGSAAVTSFDLNYTVNGGAAVTQSVSGVNIASLADYSFTHSTQWTPTATGNYTIKVWASNINGSTDLNNANDTLEATVQVVANVVQRLPLYETFTSSTCGPCVAGNINMEGLYDANPGKWVAIKYQMSWPGSGDPYYTAEGGVRRTYYGVNSVPRQEIDGGYDGNSSSVTQADFDAAYNIPSFVNLSAYMIDDTVAHHVTVGVTINNNIDLPASARLYVGIVEKKTFNNTGSNGETEFHWVMKKMLPDADGMVVGPITNGATTVKFMDYTFKGNYRKPNNATDPINHSIEHSVEEFSDLIAVAWIQNYDTKEVYQSCYSSVTLGMAKNHPEELVSKTYPNPASSKVNFDLKLKENAAVSVKIFSANGKKINAIDFGKQSLGTSKLSVDVSTFESGIYFFQFNINGVLSTQPVVVR